MTDISSASILLFIMLWPLFLAFALAFRSTQSMALQLTPWAAFPIFVYALFNSGGASFSLPWLFLGSEIGIADEMTRQFLLFTALLWLLAGLFAHSYLAGKPRQKTFSVYFLLAMSGNIGLILAQDLGSFYLFFALMSFASYGLVAHERTFEALRAGRIYMVLVVIGELALFGAMLLAVSSTNATSFEGVRAGLQQAESINLIILLGLVGFGIKAGVIGLHVWLPLAHPVAPSPASAVLSGAMIKAGLLGWLRLLPLGDSALLQWGGIFIMLGLLSTFYGVIIGLTQRDPKTLLAYSSISQMGIMTMMVGLALASPDAYPLIIVAITLYAMHHGLNKGALFLAVAVISASNVAQRRWLWPAIALPSLALAGAPLTSGMLVKSMLGEHAVNAPQLWASVLPALLVASALATTLLIGRLLILLARIKPTPAGKPLSTGLLLPWAILVLSTLIVPWWFAPTTAWNWTPQLLFGSLWPLLVGGLIIAVARWWARHRYQSTSTESPTRHVDFFPVLPAGDLLIPLSAAFKWLLCMGQDLTKRVYIHWQQRITSSTHLKPTLSWPKFRLLNQSDSAESISLLMPGLAWLLVFTAMISLLILPSLFP